MFKDGRGRGNYNLFKGIYGIEGQVNVSYSYPGTIRAFHKHLHQADNWYVVKGNLEVALYNKQDGLRLKYLGEGDPVLQIVAGDWHGFRVLGQEEAVLLYYVTNKYDPDNPDEIREEWNAFYNWETPKK